MTPEQVILEHHIYSYVVSFLSKLKPLIHMLTISRLSKKARVFCAPDNKLEARVIATYNYSIYTFSSLLVG